MTLNELYNSPLSMNVTMKYSPRSELGQVTVIVNRKHNKIPPASSQDIFDWLRGYGPWQSGALSAGHTIVVKVPHRKLAEWGVTKGI